MEVPRKFYGSSWEVPRNFHRSAQEVPRKFYGSAWEVPRKFHRSSGIITCVIEGCQIAKIDCTLLIAFQQITLTTVFKKITSRNKYYFHNKYFITSDLTALRHAQKFRKYLCGYDG